VLVSASWNGATEVARWLVLAGDGVGSMDAVRSVARKGFETSVAVETDRRYVQVRALDARGTVLGSSRPIEPAR